MKAKNYLFFLFVIYALNAEAQTVLQFRCKADSCHKAGNLRAADSLYTLALTSQPNDKDYMSRAVVRRKLGVPCSACGDLFSASVLGNKQAKTIPPRLLSCKQNYRLRAR